MLKKNFGYRFSFLAVILCLLVVYLFPSAVLAGTATYISGDWESAYLSEVFYDNKLVNSTSGRTDHGSVTMGSVTKDATTGVSTVIFTLTAKGNTAGLGCIKTDETTTTELRITTSQKVTVAVDASGIDDGGSAAGTYEANSKLTFKLTSNEGAASEEKTATVTLTITPVGKGSGIPTDAARYYVSTDKSYHYYLDSAITAANGSGTITVVESGTVYAAGDLTNNTFTIPNGVELLIPYAADDTGSFGTYNDGVSINTMTALESHYLIDEDDNGSVRNFAYRTLTLPSQYKILCNGTINVNGRYQGNGQPFTGVSLGGYGQLILGEETSTYQGKTDEAQLIIGSTGKLYCYGYITGTGMVEVQSGGVIAELLQVCDWPGGSAAVGGITSKGWKDASDSIKDKTQFLLSQYYVQNVEAPLKVNYGAKAYAEAIINATITVRNTIEYIGSNGMFILADQNSYLLREYDPATGRMNYHLYGNASLGSLTIEINSQTLKSSDYILPINNNMTLIMEDGSSVTLGQRVSVLPGAQIIVREGATLNLTNLMYLWSYKDWTSSYMFTRNGLSNNHTPVPHVATGDRGLPPKVTGTYKAIVSTASDGTKSYFYYYTKVSSYSSAGKLQVDGVLNISGSGAIVHTNSASSSSTGRYVYGSGIINYTSGLTATPVIYAGKDAKVSSNKFETVFSLAKVPGYSESKNLGTTGTYFGVADKWYQYYVTATGDMEGLVLEQPVTPRTLNADGTITTGTEVTNVAAYVMNGECSFTVAQGYSVTYNGEVLTGTQETDSTRIRYTIEGITSNTSITITKNDNVQVELDGAVARVYWLNGEKYDDYVSLNEAVADAVHSKDRVQLLTDVTISEALSVNADQDLILDLNGKTITSTVNKSCLLGNTGTLEIVGGGTMDNSACTYSETAHATIYNKAGGTITKIENVTINGNGCALHNRGTINAISGKTTLSAVQSGGYAYYTYRGTLVSMGGADGDVTLTSTSYGMYLNGGEITRLGDGGKVTLTSTDKPGIYMKEGNKIVTIGGPGSTVSITGGTYAIQMVKAEITNLGGNGGSVTIASANSSSSAIYMTDTGSKIVTIGGPGSTVSITGYYALNLTKGEITNIGGALTETTKGTVTITGKYTSIYAVGGTIGTLGGSGSDVTVTGGTNGIYVSSGGITQIGGGKVTINANGASTDSAEYAAVKVAGGKIGTIGGPGSDITMTCASHGIYMTAGEITSIGGVLTETETTRGTVNITANGTEVTNDPASLVFISGGKIGTIGGSGSNLTLTAANYGIYMAGGEITEIGGTEGNVQLSTYRPMIYMKASTGSKIGTIGGENSYVKLSADVPTRYGGSTHGIEMRDGSKIGTIGGTNAEVWITVDYTGTDGSTSDTKTVARLIPVYGGASIDLIGGTGAKIYMKISSTSGQSCMGLLVSGAKSYVGKIGGADVGKVELIARNNALYPSSGEVGEVSGNVLVISTLSSSTPINISDASGRLTLKGGYFYNSKGNIITNKGTLTYGPGMGMSTDKVTVHSDVMNKDYTCYYVTYLMPVYNAVSLSTQGEVLLNQKFYIPKALQTTGFVEITEEGNAVVGDAVTVTKSLSEFTPDDSGRYVISQGIAAGEMTGTVTVRFKDSSGNYVKIHDGTQEVDSIERTVLDYAAVAFAQGSEKTKHLCSAALTYGGYAQKYFGVDVDNPAYNYDTLKAYDISEVGPDTIKQSLSTSGPNIGITNVTQSVNLNSKLYLRTFFKLDESAEAIEKYTVKVTIGDDAGTSYTVEPVYTGSRYYVDIRNIPVAYWDQYYTIEISNSSGNVYRITSSVMAWADRCIEAYAAGKTTEELANVAKAMYWYNVAADANFATQN